MAEWAFYVRVKGEVAVDSGDGLEFGLHGVDGQDDPAPVVYVDGVEQASTTYTYDGGDSTTEATVTFDTSKAGQRVTVDYRWKYTCSDLEDASVYEVGKEVNAVVGVDVNGRTIISSSYVPCTNFAGVLQWEYMEKAFWTEWQTIVENDYLFDIERTTDNTEPRALTKLKVTSYPRFIDIPDVVDRIHVGVEFVQVTAE